jgi:hypothetical protein
MKQSHLLLGLLVVGVLVWWFFIRQKGPIKQTQNADGSVTVTNSGSDVDLTFGMPQVISTNTDATTTGPKSVSGFTS